MAPPNPKRPPVRPPKLPVRAGAGTPPREEELPFDEELSPVRGEPSSKVPQLPLAGRPRASGQSTADVEATAIYDAMADPEFVARYGTFTDPSFTPAFLYVERGPGAGQLVPVRQGTLIIGRVSGADLRLQHASISRRHAELMRDGNRYFLRDLGSQNGTFVNRSRIESEVELQLGDAIAVGNAMVKLRGPNNTTQVDAPPLFGAEQPTSGESRAAGPGVTRLVLMASAVGAVIAIVVTLASSQLYGDASETDNESEDKVTARAPGTSGAPTPPAAAPATAATDSQKAEEKAATKPAPSTTEPAPIHATSPSKAQDTPARPNASSSTNTARKPTASSKPAPTASKPAPKPVNKGPTTADVVNRYASGDVAGAIHLAQEGRHDELEGRLSALQGAHAAGEKAVASRDIPAAIRQFTTALGLDEKIARGSPSRYGAQVKVQLSKLHTLVGVQQLKADNRTAAKASFTAAVELDKGNTQARSQLSTLESGPSRAPVRRAIEDAWDDAEDEDSEDVDEEEPQSQRSPSGRGSSIDQAFGDE